MGRRTTTIEELWSNDGKRHSLVSHEIRFTYEEWGLILDASLLASISTGVFVRASAIQLAEKIINEERDRVGGKEKTKKP